MSFCDRTFCVGEPGRVKESLDFQAGKWYFSFSASWPLLPVKAFGALMVFAKFTKGDSVPAESPFFCMFAYLSFILPVILKKSRKKNRLSHREKLTFFYTSDTSGFSYT